MSEWTGRTIANREDVARAIAELTRHDRAGTSALARAVQTGAEAELTPDRSRLLPVLPEVAPILPWPGGLLRGATVAVVGSTSLVLTLLAGAMAEGSWAAVVGMPSIGALAAEEYGVPLDRLGLVRDPGPDWPIAVGALIDGVDMVVVRATADEATIPSLQARAREKGCVLVPVTAWPGADLVIERTSTRWQGLKRGRGRLRWQEATFRVTGRGRASKARTWQTVFPPVPRDITAEQVARAREIWDVLQEAERIRQRPRHGSIPENLLPADGEENPLWTNLTPHAPPSGL